MKATKQSNDNLSKRIKEIPIELIKINEKFKNYLPPLSKKQRKGLSESIIRDGVTEPLIVRKGTLEMIEGHHRLTEMIVKGFKVVPVIEIEFDSDGDVKKFMLERQVNRRNSNEFQRVVAAIELEKTSIAKGKENMGKHGLVDVDQKVDTNQTLAEMSDSSRANVGKVKYILKNGSQDIIDRVGSDELTIHGAHKLIKGNNKPKATTIKAVNNSANDTISKDNAEIETSVSDIQDDEIEISPESSFTDLTTTVDTENDCENEAISLKQEESDNVRFTTVYVKAVNGKKNIQGDWISNMPQGSSYTVIIEARPDNFDDAFRFIQIHDLKYSWSFYTDYEDSAEGYFLIVAGSDNKVSQASFPKTAKIDSNQTSMIPAFILKNFINEATGDTVILNCNEPHETFYTWNQEKGLMSPLKTCIEHDEPSVTPELTETIDNSDDQLKGYPKGTIAKDGKYYTEFNGELTEITFG